MPVMAEDVRHYCVQLAASTLGVGRVRRTTGKVLHDWGLAELVDVAEVLLTELLTNVLVHVGPGAWHALTLLHDGDVLRVEVRDSSPRMPVARVGAWDEESGRGLRMIDGLAHAWGADRLPPGKVVWFTLPDTVCPTPRDRLRATGGT
jgi:hypothetical protein